MSEVSHVPSPMPRPDLRRAADALEARFLSDMLGAAGLGAPRDAFGGGAGEASFASFLRDAHADALVSRGGLGLSEHIYRALLERADG